jgi:hypothetical protein
MSQAGSSSYVCHFAERTIEGHYRYCNDFLWPIMHDLPEYASFVAEDMAFYQQFNLAVAANVLYRGESAPSPSIVFGPFHIHFSMQRQGLGLLAHSLAKIRTGSLCGSSD